jgi:hypothetical protein
MNIKYIKTKYIKPLNSILPLSLSLTMAFSFSACTNGTPEVESLSSQSSLRVTFSGKMQTTINIDATTTSIHLSGECDKRIKSLKISTDNGKNWITPPSSSSDTSASSSEALNSDLDCSDQKFSFTIDNPAEYLGFSADSKGGSVPVDTPYSKTILIRGEFKGISSSASEVVCVYTPAQTTTPPVATTPPAAGGGGGETTPTLDNSNTVISQWLPATPLYNSLSPTLQITGISSGDILKIYPDLSSCTIMGTTFWTGTATGASLNLVMTGLTENTTYSFYSRTFNTQENHSNCSSSFLTYTPDVTPPAVFNLTGVDGGTDTDIDIYLTGGLNPKIHWSASTGADYYIATIYQNDGTTIQCPATNSTTNFYNFSGCALGDSQSYKAKVVAYDNAGNSYPTTLYSFTVDAILPAIPSSLALFLPATSPGNNATPTIRVSATPQTGDVVQLFKDSNCTFANLVGSTTVVSAGRTYVDISVSSALINGTSYIFYANTKDSFFTSTCSATSVSYMYDNGQPTVTISRAGGQSNSTTTTPVIFTVVFSKAIDASTFTANDLTYTGSASISSSSLTQNNSTTYTLTVTPATYGTIVPALLAGAVSDSSGNSSSASSITDNTVTYWPPVPGPLNGLSLITPAASPGNSLTPTLRATVPSSLSIGDVIKVYSDSSCITEVGSATAISWGSSQLDITTSSLTNGTSYTFYAKVFDNYGQSSACSATNSVFVNYTVDTISPTITINSSVTQTDPTNSNGILFTVVFSEAIDPGSFTAGDITYSGSAGISGSSLSAVDSTTYTLTVTASTYGTVVPSIPANSVTDLAGNLSSASTSTDHSVFYQPAPPSSIALQTPGSSPNTIASPTFTIAGLTINDSVALYSDAACSTSISSSVASGGASATVTTNSLAEGSYTIYAKRIVGGISSNCSSSINVFASYHYLTLSINPLYSIAPNWNDYVKNDGADQFHATNTACTGTETYYYSACLHGGEKRKIILPGYANCTGLTMTDNLDAFNWVCDSNGTVEFYSAGLKPGRGLAQLLNGAAWQGFGVNLYVNGNKVLSGTPSTTVWGNSVITTLPVTIVSSSTIYNITIDTGISGTNINADKVAIVVQKTKTLRINSGANNCNTANGETGSSSALCLISAGAQNFLWIEGAFQGDNSVGANPTISAHYGIFFKTVKFSRLNNIQLYDSTKSGIYLDSSSNNILTGLRLAYHNTDNTFIGGSIHLNLSNYNTISDVTTSFNSYAGITSSGILLNSSSYNILTKIISSANLNSGITLTNSSTNMLSYIDTINNGQAGTNKDGIYVNNSPNNNLNQIVSLGNGGNGINLSNSLGSNVSQVFTKQNTSNGISESNSDATYNGHIYSNSCSSSSTIAGPGIQATTCVINRGTASYSAGSAIAASTFIGSFQDISNPLAFSTSFTTTGSLFTTQQYLSFSNPFRIWQENTALGAANGFCQTGPCDIYDYALKSADTALRNLTVSEITGGTFTPDVACPASVDGNKSQSITLLSSSTVTYLQNAYEIQGDGIGNDNGLCESNETCAFAPNYGAFQGHSDPNPNLSCVFNSVAGIVSNVKMLGVSYAHLDQEKTTANASEQVGLLEGNTVIKKIAGPSISASRANIGKTSGKWYFEVKIESVGGSGVSNSTIGFGTATSSLTNYVGVETGANISYGYDGSLISGAGKFYTGGTPSGTPAAYIAGDIIGVAIDLDNHKLWFSKNGVWQTAGGDPGAGTNPAFASISAVTLYPMISLRYSPILYRANFGQNHFSYPVPTGFNPGWY